MGDGVKHPVCCNAPMEVLKTYQGRARAWHCKRCRAVKIRYDNSEVISRKNHL